MKMNQNVIRTLLIILLGILPDAERALKLQVVGQAIKRKLLDESKRLFLNEMSEIAQARHLSALYDAMNNLT